MVLPTIKCGKYHCGCDCVRCELARARRLDAKAHCRKHDRDCHANCF